MDPGGARNEPLQGKKVNSVLDFFKSLASWLREVTLPLYSVLVRAHRGVLAPQYMKDMEGVQQNVTKINKGLDNLSCEERLRELGLLDLEKVHRGLYKDLKEGGREDGGRLLLVVPSDRTRGTLLDVGTSATTHSLRGD